MSGATDTLRFALGVGTWALFTTRLGMWGWCRVPIYKDDVEIGVFSRWFYDVAQFRIAGSTQVTEVWSVSPIQFQHQYQNRNAY